MDMTNCLGLHPTNNVTGQNDVKNNYFHAGMLCASSVLVYGPSNSRECRYFGALYVAVMLMLYEVLEIRSRPGPGSIYDGFESIEIEEFARMLTEWFG